MKIYDRRELAIKVWQILKPMLKKIKGEWYIGIGSYQNGGEQGLSVNCPACSFFICWSESRSDEVVVYETLFDPCQGISDSMYDDKVFFHTPKEAATYICRQIENKISIRLEEVTKAKHKYSSLEKVTNQ